MARNELKNPIYVGDAQSPKVAKIPLSMPDMALVRLKTMIM
jgi:hypothetical protein